MKKPKQVEGGESKRFKKSEKVAYTPPSERPKPKKRGK